MDVVLYHKVVSLLDWSEEDVVLLGLHGLPLEGNNLCTPLLETWEFSCSFVLG